MKRKKTGGRQSGSVNRLTADLRAMLDTIVGDYYNSGQAVSNYANMSPKERIELTIKMLGFIIPKPQSIAVDINKSAANDAFTQELNRLLQEPDE